MDGDVVVDAQVDRLGRDLGIPVQQDRINLADRPLDRRLIVGTVHDQLLLAPAD